MQRRLTRQENTDNPTVIEMGKGVGLKNIGYLIWYTVDSEMEMSSLYTISNSLYP